MQRRFGLLLVAPLVIPVVAVAALAVPGRTSSGPEGGGVHLPTATSSEPVDGTIPTTSLSPLYEDYESMCPGLDLDSELIPPYFDTQIELIPDPHPVEVCLLLQQAAEAAATLSP